MNATTANYKATKIQQGSKTFVVVTDAEGNEYARMGGKRAERAKAVVLTVTEYRYNGELFRTARDAGCRQGIHAAAVDANANRGNGQFFSEVYYKKAGGDGEWVPASVTRESYAIRID